MNGFPYIPNIRQTERGTADVLRMPVKDMESEGRTVTAILRQDLRAVFPEAIHPENGAVDYQVLVPVLVRAIQQLHGRVMALENQLRQC